MDRTEQSVTFVEFDNICTVSIHAIQGRGMDDGPPLTDADSKNIKSLLSQCRGLANKVSRCLNIEINRSELSSMMRRYVPNQPFKVSPMLFDFIEENLRVNELTEGDFDFTIGPLLNALKSMSNPQARENKDQIRAILTRVGSRHITLDKATSAVIIDAPDMMIASGATIKGFAVKYMANHLIANGVTSGYINMSGSIYVIGSRPDNTPWRTAIANPAHNDVVIGSIALRDQGVLLATTDDRGFEKGTRRYRHLINPYTGELRRPGLISATCVADDPWIADIMGTVLFLIGLERSIPVMDQLSAAHDIDIAYIAIDEQGHIHTSPSIQWINPDNVRL